MRLIDADKLKERLFVEEDYDVAIEEEVYSFQCGWNDALKSVMQFAPTVEPKHGHWVMSNGDYEWECSSCGGGLSDYKTAYCPDCGAKMDEVENDID